VDTWNKISYFEIKIDIGNSHLHQHHGHEIWSVRMD
jgi:hypothetical protein